MKLFFELPENVMINKKAVVSIAENAIGCYILMLEPSDKYYTTSMSFQDAKQMLDGAVNIQGNKISFNPLYHEVDAK